MPILKRFLPFFAIYLTIQTLLRASLLGRAIQETAFSHTEILQIFARGLWFDLVTMSFFLIPIALYHFFLPTSKQGTRTDRKIDSGIRMVFIFILLFDAVAQHIFWSEFTTRFNFIAVDYLIYTNEVIGNIVESYPIVWIILAIMLAALIVTAVSIWLVPLKATRSSLGKRFIALVATIAVSIGLYSASSINQSQFDDNAEAQELAANGVYNLFYAFWHNEISYDRFYPTLPNDQVKANLMPMLDKPYTTRPPEAPDTNIRIVNGIGAELRKNVIIVGMESMSAMYMEEFGNTQNITPNLDRLAKQGLFFTNLYATGTRTVRGLEALTLSIPPTPGQSLVRRTENENLFSLGYIFKDRGYDTRFIYGGYGYFDNMNNFFAGNGFDIVDRTTLSKPEINFANVWGVADDDMFARAIREADASYARKKPFMHIIMTTSNHRPYTYPDGRINIPSGSNRSGGVMYADYSVGKLLEWARPKPWFNDTIFVFVADHTAGAGGRVELDPRKYHIPMIFYAPGSIKPQRYEALASQIDMAPTLLGLLNFTYYSKFYGTDVLRDEANPRTFVSNYQKVALVKNDSILILSPKQTVTQYAWPKAGEKLTVDQALADEAITYYQSAAWWRDTYRRINTVVK